MVLSMFQRRPGHEDGAAHLGDLTLNDILSPSDWVDKKDRVGCADCGLKFSNLFRRRHHCRLCGDLFCKPCVVHQRLASFAAQVGEANSTATSPTIKICRSCACNRDSNSPTLTASGASTAMASMFARHNSTKHHTTNCKVMEQLSKSCRGRLATAPFSTTTTISANQETHVHHLVAPTESQAQADERRRVRAAKKLHADAATTSENLAILMTAAAKQCPMAYVSLIDDKTQHFKASVGLGALASKARSDADLCDWVVTTAEPLVVLDAAQDLRFRHTSLVVDSSVRFYAGVPLVDDKGLVVGTLAIMDTAPRTSCDVLPLQAMASGALLALRDHHAGPPADMASHHTATYLNSMPRSQNQPTPPPRPASQSAPSSPRKRSASLFDTLDASLNTRMLNVLNTSTSTQTQLAQQQGHLVQTMSNHSEMINRLALAIERMESKLASPLNHTKSPTPIEGA